MQKIIDFNSQKDHYTADACIVWCFDARFSQALDEFAKQQGFLLYDLISVAGGAKSLASPASPRDQDFSFNQINTSLVLHHTKKIILMNHLDCGAYGGSAVFENDEEKEREFLCSELKKARQFLEEKLSEPIKIELVFVDFQGLWQV